MSEEITERMTHVNLVQVYAALTYYHANREEIEGYFAAEKANRQTTNKKGKLLSYEQQDPRLL